jgi:hypothetical protein
MEQSLSLYHTDTLVSHYLCRVHICLDGKSLRIDAFHRGGIAHIHDCIEEQGQCMLFSFFQSETQLSCVHKDKTSSSLDL